MEIAVLGTGTVGTTIATRLSGLGHSVVMGARGTQNQKATAWAKEHGAKHDTFRGAVKDAELVVLATLGGVALDVLESVGSEVLSDKVLLDLTNPLDFSRGAPPTLFIDDTDSLAERIQRAHPRLRVVKSLNTMSAEVMVRPERVPGPHDVFMAGNDAEAKSKVRALLLSFGWSAPLDLGELRAARGLEHLLPMWLRLSSSLGTSRFNFYIARERT